MQDTGRKSRENVPIATPLDRLIFEHGDNNADSLINWQRRESESEIEAQVTCIYFVLIEII